MGIRPLGQRFPQAHQPDLAFPRWPGDPGSRYPSAGRSRRADRPPFKRGSPARRGSTTRLELMKEPEGMAYDDRQTSDRAGFTIRSARPEDAETIAGLVRELAIYEKLEEHVNAIADDFRRHLFGPRPAAEAALA